MFGSREHLNCDILCSLFHHVLSHFSFYDWLTRRPAHSPYVSFTITPVADGVDEGTVYVMMSNRASPVRLNVSLSPFSVFRGLFNSKALLLARRLTVTNSVYFLLSMAWCLVCRLFVHFAQLFAE